MKKTVNNSGITLIALVVTIVVLLILAGITITYVLAEGGLFSRATEAKEAAEIGAIRDYMAVASADAIAEYYVDGTTDLTATVTANFPASEVSVESGTVTWDTTAKSLKGSIVVEVVDTENQYTVDFETNEVEKKSTT